jgi:uncharacterized protein
MKSQILLVHGGDTFNTYEEYFSFLAEFPIEIDQYRVKKVSWKRGLPDVLGTDYEVIAPDMPSKGNAKYAEWKLWFEKFFPYLDSKVILVGHSLGGTFLAKYLSENEFPKTVRALFMVSAPFDDRDADYSLADFTLPKNLSLLAHQAQKIFLYYSRDDRVVPFADLKKYQSALPNAIAKIFTDRGHFNQETFPELVHDIQSIG